MNQDKFSESSGVNSPRLQFIQFMENHVIFSESTKSELVNHLP